MNLHKKKKKEKLCHKIPAKAMRPASFFLLLKVFKSVFYLLAMNTFGD